MTYEPWHGTSGGYTNHKCKCDRCREAWRITCAQQKENRKARLLGGESTASHPSAQSEPQEHGTESTYTNWSCRCAECTEAHRVYNYSKR